MIFKSIGKLSLMTIILMATPFQANAGNFTIDDSTTGDATYWGGLHENDASHGGLDTSKKDIIGDAEYYGADSLKLSTDSKTLTAVISGSFFSQDALNINKPYSIYAGDLFLSTTGWTVEGTDAHHASDNSTKGDWNYVLHLDDNSKLSGIINLYSVNEDKISNPEDYLSAYGPTAYRTGQEYLYNPGNQTSLGTGNWLIDAALGTLTITLTLPEIDYGLTGALGVHWTMACGNDVIEGMGNPVPEPTTMLLFGAGIIGLAGVRRRIRK